MATAGALKEGWSYAYGPRYNDTLFRGQVTVPANSTSGFVVTIPLPIRFVGFPQAEIVANSAPNAGHVVTVGNIGSGGGNKANQFTIFVWQATSSAVTTLITATVNTIVTWQAWGSVTDNFVTSAY